jgi:hypothetical protein
MFDDHFVLSSKVVALTDDVQMLFAMFIFVLFDGVRLCLWTAATNGPITPPDDMSMEP